MLRSNLSPTKWGDWTLDRDRLVLVHHGGGNYEVDLETADTPAAALDWLIQVQQKGWCSRKCLGALAEAVVQLIFKRYGLDQTRPPDDLAAKVLENELHVRAEREMNRRREAGLPPWRADAHGITSGTYVGATDDQVEVFRRLRDGGSR